MESAEAPPAPAPAGQAPERILFVDDEEQALKYFRLAFQKEYRVETATSADAGWEVVQRHGGEIALLISDQRMPGRAGVELLAQVRRAYPSIIRVLTTAHADLQSAIDSVNNGAIYQYIKKPWELPELRVFVRRAIDFYRLQNERDLLLRAKLSILQRLLLADRVQGLALVAAGLQGQVDHAAAALAAFLQGLPAEAMEAWAQAEADKGRVPWRDLSSVAEEEGRGVLELAHALVALTAGASSGSTTGAPSAWLAPAVEAAGGASAVQLEIEGAPEAEVDAGMLGAALGRLFRGLAADRPGAEPARVTAAAGELGSGLAALVVRASLPEHSWDGAALGRCYQVLVGAGEPPPDLSLGLLATFLAAYHHGGTVRILENGAAGVEVVLPLSPANAPGLAGEGDPLGVLLEHYERWDTALL